MLYHLFYTKGDLKSFQINRNDKYDKFHTPNANSSFGSISLIIYKFHKLTDDAKHNTNFESLNESHNAPINDITV